MDEQPLGEEIRQVTEQFREFRERCRVWGIQEPTQQEVDGRNAQASNLIDFCIGTLAKWRRRSNYPALYNIEESNLNQLQEMFEEAYFCLKDYMTVLDDHCYSGRVNDIQRLMTEMISKSFVMENNPVQVNKLINVKSSAQMEDQLQLKIRCLLPQLFPSPPLQPKVVVRVLGQSRSNRSRQASLTPTITPSSTTNRAVWDQLTVTGRIQHARPMKKNDDSLLYVIRFEFKHAETEAVVETLPIAFYTHTSQIPIVSGPILWFNAFSDPVDPCVLNDSPPLEASMANVLCVLNEEFHNETSVIAKSLKSARGGSDDQRRSSLKFGEKNERCLKETLGGSDRVTKDAFLRNRIGRASSFTFWEWFYACYKTKCEYLAQLYERRLLFGFITKEDAENLLTSMYDTTGSKLVLLRFSMNYLDSHHGYISPSIIRSRNNPEHGNPIKAKKYNEDCKKLGLVLLNEIGEHDDGKLRILKMNETSENFSDAFHDFMVPMEHFVAYTQLNQDAEGSVRTEESVASPDHISGATSPVSTLGDYNPQRINDLDSGTLPSFSNLSTITYGPCPNTDVLPMSPSEVDNGADPLMIPEFLNSLLNDFPNQSNDQFQMEYD